MTSPLQSAAFRTLFAAQVASLLAVGLMTVALTLLAYRIGGASAGQILGLLLAIKMVAYVFCAPLAEALLRGKPRRPVMIGLTVGRVFVRCFGIDCRQPFSSLSLPMSWRVNSTLMARSKSRLFPIVYSIYCYRG